MFIYIYIYTYSYIYIYTDIHIYIYTHITYYVLPIDCLLMVALQEKPGFFGGLAMQSAIDSVSLKFGDALEEFKEEMDRPWTPLQDRVKNRTK